MTIALAPTPSVQTLHLDPIFLAGYFRFCGEGVPALEEASLTRWRMHLAQHTPVTERTISLHKRGKYDRR